MVRGVQCFAEFSEKSLCSCIGVRLEDDPQLFMRILLGSGKRCLDFCRMMRVVVDDPDVPADAPEDIEAAVDTFVLMQRIDDIVYVDAQNVNKPLKTLAKR